MADVTPVTQGAGRAYAKLAFFALILVGGFLVARLTPLGDFLSREGIDQAIGWMRGSRWAPIVFIALYAGATAMAIPGTILTLAGGVLFGFFWGTVFNSIAANLGANLAFLVARFLGREGIERMAGDRLEKLDQATRNHGFQGLFTLRLVPLVPFNALNFGSGLTALRWRTYAVATVIGIFPGTVVYTMFADALLQGSQEASREALIRVLISGGLLVLLSFLPQIMRKLNIRVPGLAPILVATLLAAPGLSAQDRGALPDHSAFGMILEHSVKAPLVDYAWLATNRQRLDAYLEAMAETDPAALAAASRPAKLAFWINAYNACMLRQVVDHYPIQKNTRLLDRAKNAILDRPENSVWQIPDVFGREHCRIAGEDRSQDEIEHEIIRPMGDPRIHFAVNCAAMSCPPLTTWAFDADHLDEQLDRIVREFVANAAHFELRTGDRAELRLNKVLDWYKDDFGGIDGLRDFFSPYLDEDARRVVASRDTKVEFFDYDWTLNDVNR